MSSPLDQTTEKPTINNDPSTAGGGPDTGLPATPLLDLLKSEMKDASLLDYIPLDKVEMNIQTEVPNTIPQMCKLGTVASTDGGRLTLVACMSSKGIPTARDGGIPRIHFFTYDLDGLSKRRHITAREVSRLDSLNDTFAPANANPDILNALLKYVFMMKGAPFPAGVQFLFGFTRALQQACRAYKDVAAAKSTATPKSNASAGASPTTREPSPEVEEMLDGSADVDMLDSLPQVEDVQSPPGSEAPNGDVDTAASPTDQPNVESSATERPQASLPAVKRTLDEYEELLEHEQVAKSEVEAIDGAKSLMEMIYEASRAQLVSEQEAARKVFIAQQAAELDKLDKAHQEKREDIIRQYATPKQTKEKVAEKIGQIEQNTPRKDAWGIIRTLIAERPAKRQKVVQEEDGEMMEE